jgi:hypothetical protein
MKCDAARKAIAPYLDGAPGEVQAGELMDHIDSCPGCRREMNYMQSLRIAIRTRVARVGAPEALRNSVEKLFGQGGETAFARMIAWLRPRPALVLAGAAAAVAVATALLVSPAANAPLSPRSAFAKMVLSADGILSGSTPLGRIASAAPDRVRPGFSISGLVPADQVRLKFTRRGSATGGAASKIYASNRLRLRHADLAYAENDSASQTPELVFTSLSE